MNARPASCPSGHGAAPADGVAQAAGELAQLLFTAYPPQAVLDRVAALSLCLVPGSTGATCSFYAEGAPVEPCLTPTIGLGVVTLCLAVDEGDEHKVVAVLTLHGPAEAFDGFEAQPLGPFLTRAAITLHNVRAFHAATELNAQLRDALTSRAIIEQAKGAIMARRHVSAESAFELLRRSSTRRNVKLRDVAQEVVDSTQPR